MLKILQKQSKLAPCLALALALAVGAATTSAEAAIAVTTYGAVGDPAPIWVSSSFVDSGMTLYQFDLAAGGTVVDLWMDTVGGAPIGGAAAAHGASADHTSTSVMGWGFDTTLLNGATAGDDNYMFYDSKDGISNGTPDTVARFNFNTTGGSLAGSLMSIAYNSGGISFADGVAALNAPVAATPEPAGFLLGGVPALVGAGALLRRRVRPGASL